MRFPRFLESYASNEQLRFITVGGFNTILGLIAYSTIQYFYGQFIGYLGSLLIAHFLVSILAFFLYRQFVFNKSGTALIDFLKFQAVYSVSLGINLVVLPLVIHQTGFNPYIAQIISVLLVTIISYLGHKFFSFRRSTQPRLNKKANPPF